MSIRSMRYNRALKAEAQLCYNYLCLLHNLTKAEDYMGGFLSYHIIERELKDMFQRGKIKIKVMPVSGKYKYRFIHTKD